MSYSITNVLKEAGIKNIIRWLPFDLEEEDCCGRLANKMIRPTTIPQTLEELIIEHAVAREALRLGLNHHKTIATRLKGAKVSRGISDLFEQALEETYIDMMNFDIVAGTGGLLSHAPSRVQSLLILSDAFQVTGLTWLFQDSVFMMPHLGVLSTVHQEASWQIFDKDCLVRLGTVIAPRGLAREGEPVMTVELQMPNGETVNEEVVFGEIKHIALEERQEAKVIVTPRRAFDVGGGSGHKFESTAMGGVVGIVLDGRGRPLQMPEEPNTRKELLLKWYRSLNLYPEDDLKELL
jgi:hypothetical protein